MAEARIRIRRVDGQWYAFASGPKKERNLKLVPAIRYCQALNKSTPKEIPHGK